MTILLLGQLAWSLDPGPHLLDMELVTHSRVPVLGRLELTTHSQALVEITREEDRLVARQRVCDVQMRGSVAAKTVLPDRFIASLPETRFAIVARPDGTLVLDQGPQAVGFDPSRRPSPPTRADDPSVIDSDRDGAPGATVQVRVPLVGRVDVYVAQLAHTRLVGSPDGDGLHGVVETVTYAQNTLGATHPFFRKSPRVTPADGRFTLVPTSATSCASLREPS